MRQEECMENVKRSCMPWKYECCCGLNRVHVVEQDKLVSFYVDKFPSFVDNNYLHVNYESTTFGSNRSQNVKGILIRDQTLIRGHYIQSYHLELVKEQEDHTWSQTYQTET